MESSGHMTDSLLVMSKVRVDSGQFIFHLSFSIVPFFISISPTGETCLVPFLSGSDCPNLRRTSISMKNEK